MLAIRLNGTLLDLYPNTELSIELNSTLYLGEDVEVMQGSFAFPISLPLSPDNNVSLNYPSALDNPSTFLSNQSCEIYFKGNLLLKGFLTVKECSKYSAKVEIIFNPFKALAKSKLNVLDMGIYNFPATLQDNLNLMESTALAPDAYPFIYVPVLNTGWDDTSSYNTVTTWQNYWDSRSQHNSIPKPYFDNTSIVTPFLKISYILNRILSLAGDNLKDEVFRHTELNRLCVYHNHNIMTDSGIVDSIELNKFLSTTETSAFLKKLLRHYNCGLFYDFRFNEIKIRSAADIINMGIVEDITDKVGYSYSISSLVDNIRSFKNKNNIDIIDTSQMTTYQINNFNQIATQGEGIYKLGNRIFIYKYGPLYDRIIEMSGKDDIVYIADTGTDYESDLTILNYAKFYIDTHTVDDLEGAVIAYKKDDELDNDYIIVYRGTVLNNAEYWGPTSNPDLVDFKGRAVHIGNNLNISGAISYPAEYSHRWAGNNGVYEKFWKPSLNYIQNKTIIKRPIQLEIEDIYSFQFDKKYRIDNQVYLAKSLKLKITNSAIKDAEIELIKL